MEIWRDIIEYLGVYQVSNLGRVRRIYKKKKGYGYLKPIKHSGGYLRVKLRDNGYDKDRYIHRLVAEAFYGEGEEVNHKDGDKTNNRLNNLEWCNRHENAIHSHLSKETSSKYPGVHKQKGRNKFTAKLTVNREQVFSGNYKTELGAFLAYVDACERHGIKNKYAWQ